MRPLNQGPISFVSHTFVRNGVYYYRANVPTDLQQYFPTLEIKKSLKTKEPKAAKLMAISYEYKVQQAFAVIRTGALPDDTIKLIVESIVPTKRKAAVVRGKVLADVLPGYEESKKADWTPKTKMEAGGVIKLILDLIGEVELSAITRPMVLEMRSTLQKLPPNLYKKYPGKSIKQILALKDIEPMSTKSVNKHVSRLGSILKYCVDEGLITSNPALGLKVSEKKRADEERNAYSIEDVKKIVSNLPNDPSTPERYWIPLIGLYSGMRLNEICQLYITDIIKSDSR